MSDTSINTSEKKRNTRVGIYMKNILTRKVILPFNLVGGNLKKNLLVKIKNNLEGKCTTEGYIKKDSIQIISYSAGIIQASNIIYNIAFECYLCKPCVGHVFKCLVKNSTKAGIRAIYDSNEKPVTVYIAREHHNNNDEFRKTKENDYINIRVIGIKYQLNDDSISIIAELVKNLGPKKLKVKK